MIKKFKKTGAILSLTVILLIGSFGLAFGATAASSEPQTAKAAYTRIFYYRDTKEALESFKKNYRSIDVLAPQAYSVTGDGALSGKIKPEVLDLANSKGIKIMPLVTNKSFSRKDAHNFLDNPSVQQKAIDELVAEAKKFGFFGWQVDFEQMDVSYRDKFSAFIKNLGETFRKNNLTASVAVVAQISENPNDYPKDLWRKLIGVYDLSALASSADFITLMSYDDPNSKGPVAGFSWMGKVLEYTLTLVPPEKVSLGLPLYYWLWNDTKGKLMEIGGYAGITNAFKKHYLTTNYDEKEQAPYLSWRSYHNDYKLWYENAGSIKKKVELVTDNRLHGFSAWVLGLEVPTVHKVFQNM